MKENPGNVWTFSQIPQKFLPATLMILSLCGISFYLGGIFCFDEYSLAIRETSDVRLAGDYSLGHKITNFKECSINQTFFTPCQDSEKWRKYDRYRLAYMERHCPLPLERLQCLVPPPEGYKVPVRWPKSRDECWYRNIPYDWIINRKADQRWMLRQGEKFIFPGGGTMFSTGADKYLDFLEELLPEMKTGSIRTALDTGCGVASWGGYLLERGILTMSIAPKDNKAGQIQFALERGIPAMIGVLSTQRLPYPSAAFDMAHCSRCLIPWFGSEGMLLLEIDRVLRPGGFWILSGPPIGYERRSKGWHYSNAEKQKNDWSALNSLLERMCYTMHAIKGPTAIWQKPWNNTCYENREPGTIPPICDRSSEPDSAWYVPMRSCIVKQKFQFKYLAVGQTPKWPERLTKAPERARLFSGSSKALFMKDTEIWANRLEYYKSVFPQLGSNSIRNIMDMNTRYGGFAASLIDDPVWVMNVVSSYAHNSLGVIYDRGLIGAIHDWCEAFSTYPRSYDLLHLDGLFSAEGHRCEMKYVLVEMDRILRPTGHVLMRDTPYFLKLARSYARALRWNCKQHLAEVPLYDDGSKNQHMLLICQKSLWFSSSE